MTKLPIKGVAQKKLEEALEKRKKKPVKGTGVNIQVNHRVPKKKDEK